MGLLNTILAVAFAIPTLILIGKASDGIVAFFKTIIMAFIVSLLVFWFFDLIARIPTFLLPVFMFIFVVSNLYFHRDKE